MPKTGALLTDVRVLRGIIDAVPHPVFVKNDNYQFLIVNRAFCHMMGKTFDELIGKDDYAFFPQEQCDVFRAKDQEVLETGATIDNEELFTDGEGICRTILTGKSCLKLSDGTRLLVGCITDISEFRRAEATIRQLADHDYLTGLANRRGFSSIMNASLATASNATFLAILLIDLDGFKPINDLHGHDIGDAVLCEVARRLETIVRGTDMVARLGGDEFAILSPVGDPPRRSAEALAARVLKSFKRAIPTPAGEVNVGASIGIALCPLHGTSSEALLRAADVAMYRAKQRGRRHFHIYKPEVNSNESAVVEAATAS